MRQLGRMMISVRGMQGQRGRHREIVIATVGFALPLSNAKRKRKGFFRLEK